MEYPPDGTPHLVATPRHLRRRRLHGDIPDTLLVPGVYPVSIEPDRSVSAKRSGDGQTPKASRSSSLNTGRQRPGSAEAVLQRKRTTALILVILVALSIPALVLALIFAG